MNVLITGGAGFIGSHLGEALLDRGDSVTAVDDLSTGSLANIAHLVDRDGFRFVRGTVCDESAMVALVDRADMVFHLAAAVGVKLIAERPVHTIETNIHGSEIVLALASRYGTPIVLASTSEVYGKNTRTPFREDNDTTLGPTTYTRWSYACSKMVDEFLALAYHEQFGLPAVVVRLFNTIGPRQTGQYGMVVPRFVSRALRDEPIEIYGTGDQTRCFCHVADVVRALLDLVACPEARGQVINVGNDTPMSINELADTIIEMTGSGSEIRRLTYEEAYGRPFDDMMVRAPDLGKLKRLTGYEPARALRDCFQDIIDYERGRLEAGAATG